MNYFNCNAILVAQRNKNFSPPINSKGSTYCSCRRGPTQLPSMFLFSNRVGDWCLRRYWMYIVHIATTGDAQEAPDMYSFHGHSY